jgi:hypothetical protein
MKIETNYNEYRRDRNHSTHSILSNTLEEMLVATPKVEKILSKLDLGSMWQWILSFAVVTFDLELGHDIQASFPPITFSDSEKRTLYVYPNKMF